MIPLPSSITVDSSHPEFPILQIEHRNCSARIALHGAHILSWVPSGHEEVLYLSPDTLMKNGKAIRGGIPLCWPWFSAHPSDTSLPAHGFARIHVWHLDCATETPDQVILQLSLTINDLTVIAEIRLGQSLHISLKTMNQGKTAFPIGGALHSYFSVSDISQVYITGLAGAPFTDLVNTITPTLNLDPLRFDREIDAIFDTESAAEIIDIMKQRIITVEKNACPSTVVWNPWVAKAQRLSDLPDDGYTQFVCVEPAIIHRDSINLAPGASYSFSTTIHLRFIEN